MAKCCKYPDKPCKIGAQFTWWTKNKVGCRLNEWKKKTGICPYNPEIRSRKGMRLKADKDQTRLE